MKFDTIVSNPPFQDRDSRGRTPHKLWIDFTKKELDSWLVDGGMLYQISPSSFMSPSNKILTYMKEYDTKYINFSISPFFPNVGSSFASYIICRNKINNATKIVNEQGEEFSLKLNDKLFYLPVDLGKHALSIHKKVIFDTVKKLDVRHDYVTCHNVRLKETNPTLSKTKTSKHVLPVFHTNRQQWWSSVKNPYTDNKKVMWTRSGYTKPFYDDGVLGGTDMVYYVVVSNKKQGEALAHNMNSKLMQYIYKTARWSGFGNERVFENFPELPLDRKLSDDEICKFFKLTKEEVDYVNNSI